VKVLLVVKSKFMESLGVMYLSSIIKNGGHECKIVELEHSYHLAHVFGADIVGMSVMTGDMEKFKKLGLSVKNRLGCKVIVGGPDPTFFPEGYSWADEIVRGEAEQWAAYTFDSTYCICAIDNIPWPDRTDFPGFKIRDFITSRGCPYSCSYCYNSKWNKLFPHLKKVRTRDAKDVVREIHDSGARYAFFQDSCFGVDLEWVRDFVDMYTYVYWGEQRACPPFQCNLRPELVTQERMEQLKKANCVAVRMALETASDRLRKMVGRKYKKEDVFNASALLNEQKIMFMLQNIIGLPTSTIEDDLETLDMNIMCNPTYSWVSIFQPYPGTVLGDSCKNKGWYTGDYSDISDSFFDTTRLVVDERHREQLEVLQKVWATCVDYGYHPRAEELTHKNFPMLIHSMARKAGDTKLYLGLL
jgi:anaerobic magnesium-protoporphyrin IX monomethyl ester cyclase